MPPRMLTRALIAAGAGIVALTVASSAWAAPGITPGSGTWWNAASPTPTYKVTGATAAEPITLTATANGAPFVVAGSPLTSDATVALTGFPNGSGTLTASQAGSPDFSVTFGVDTTPPTLGGWSISPAANAYGWWNAAPTLTPVGCGDPDGSVDCSSRVWVSGTSASVVDQAGNVTTASFGAINLDTVKPAPGSPDDPAATAVVIAEPAFRWTPGSDAGSGVAGYELQVRVAPSATFQTIAKVPVDAASDLAGAYSARRRPCEPAADTPWDTSCDPAVRAKALPEGPDIQWRVVTFDRAGNSIPSSSTRLLTIDSSIPPAPTITGGPLGPTRDTTPTFSWSGTENTFQWSLTAAGAASPLRTGRGQGVRQATLPPLTDGDYTFRVRQVTPAGQPGADASRSFKVMTVSPPPPTITQRPSPGASGPVTFGWSTVPGAYSRWQVLATGGAIVAGPNDTPQSTAVVPALAAGAYTFQVLQVDPAGNVSGTTSETFTTSDPGGTTNLLVGLPRQNARRLRPLPGKTVPTRSPVLRWPRGPRGTTLYNVQVFQVIGKRRGVQTTLRKVASAFPRGLQWRAPGSRLRAGTCYVWRVWPYTGRAFTAQPLGISNFCVASKRVLARKAALRRAARARR